MTKVKKLLVQSKSVSAFTLTQIKKSNKVVPNMVPKGYFWF